MNNCILMAEIIQEPQLRHTPDGLELAEMTVEFPGTRAEDPSGTLRVVGWGNLAKEIHQGFHLGDRVLIEGRLGMHTINRPEGFKEKRAELTVQKIHSLGGGSITTASATVARNNTPTTLTTPTTPTTPLVNTPQPSYTEVAPANTSYERPSYAAPPQEEPDMDDIPF
ncbi:single-stranded DNA-binding protein [Calothrix sp. 336/3]|uniref:single-stranded DNA-binding protein n=1 Tax=Calothrix sp. 336/3 TaxID=1337936 RepID=UPI0004E2CF09|nr:single-stranded DNA-binding protein [Calothrix sp. 336/3]AKG24079.1 single-stranded DNA-binding protein [Calothrix sp. 336/3]